MCKAIAKKTVLSDVLHPTCSKPHVRCDLPGWLEIAGLDNGLSSNSQLHAHVRMAKVGGGGGGRKALLGFPKPNWLPLGLPISYPQQRGVGGGLGLGVGWVEVPLSWFSAVRSSLPRAQLCSWSCQGVSTKTPASARSPLGSLGSGGRGLTEGPDPLNGFGF